MKTPNTDESPILSTPVYVKAIDKMVLINRRNGTTCFQSLKPALLKLQSCCSTCALIVCLILLILSVLAVIFKPLSRVTHILVLDPNEPVQQITDEKFLSIAIDSSFIADGFRDFNISNPKLLKLMKHLSPGYLRIGGTMADRLVFIPNEKYTFKTLTSEMDGGSCAFEDDCCVYIYKHNFTMNGEEWLLLNNLANNAGFTLLFDLNVLRRSENGAWNYTNAEELIAFSQKHSLRVMWELGNEPDRFRKAFNYEVNATQLANDFITLRSILDRYPLYNKSILVGPDTTRPTPTHKQTQIYLETFLEKAGNVVDAITWHQYYFSGKTAKAMDFLNPDIFNVLYQEINTTRTIVEKLGLTNKPIWLGETSSAYSSGAPGYSDRYIATFIWLDKLGVAARTGLKVVIRQTLFQGNYALIDSNFEPNPDWWVSVLYKRLVGPEVVRCYDMVNPYVRLYCHCSKQTSSASIPSVTGNAITVFGINMKSTEARIKLEGVHSGKEMHTAYAYVLTSCLNVLTKCIKLNDVILSLPADGSLPPFNAKTVNLHPYVVMPPYSLVFWIIPAPTFKICASSEFVTL